MQQRIDLLSKQLREQETPLREQILLERSRTVPKEGPNQTGLSPGAPVPIAAWDFTRDTKDQVGRIHVQLVGTAEVGREGLVVDGKSYAMTAPLEKDLIEKTLEVRVRLGTLQQSGGGAISLQTIDVNVSTKLVHWARGI